MKIAWSTVIVIALVLAALVGLAALKVDSTYLVALGAFGTVLAGVLERVFKGGPPPAGGPVLVALLVMLGAPLACKGANAPSSGDVEAGLVVVDAACTALEAITDDGAIKTVCATVDEIAAIAKLILGARGDAGRASIGPCKQLTADVCATPPEISRGIDHVVTQRRSRLLRDAGPVQR